MAPNHESKASWNISSPSETTHQEPSPVNVTNSHLTTRQLKRRRAKERKPLAALTVRQAETLRVDGGKGEGKRQRGNFTNPTYYRLVQLKDYRLVVSSSDSFRNEACTYRHSSHAIPW